MIARCRPRDTDRFANGINAGQHTDSHVVVHHPLRSHLEQACCGDRDLDRIPLLLTLSSRGVEMTKAGLVRAKAQGKRLGRPQVTIDMDKVKELRASGKGLRTIASELGVSHQTLRNRLKREGVKRPNGTTTC